MVLRGRTHLLFWGLALPALPSLPRLPPRHRATTATAAKPANPAKPALPAEKGSFIRMKGVISAESACFEEVAARVELSGPNRLKRCYLLASECFRTLSAKNRRKNALKEEKFLSKPAKSRQIEVDSYAIT